MIFIIFSITDLSLNHHTLLFILTHLVSTLRVGALLIFIFGLQQNNARELRDLCPIHVGITGAHRCYWAQKDYAFVKYVSGRPDRNAPMSRGPSGLRWAPPPREGARLRPEGDEKRITS